VPESIGVILAGGGARGAYEVGVLSVLLPWLEKQHGQRPDVIVGTSVGALNASFLAAHANEPTEQVVEEGCDAWRKIRYRDVLEPLLSIRELAVVGRLAISIARRGIAPYSLLDPTPLATTLPRLVKFDEIRKNVADAEVGLRSCAVVATAAHTNRSVVFYDGGPDPASDTRRGIDYEPTPIKEEHVRASAAIPLAFPAVHVAEPALAQGWYFDGGTRLNTPIKPALKLGARRVIVIGLNSVAPAPRAKQRPL
jgi:NTE family protein